MAIEEILGDFISDGLINVRMCTRTPKEDDGMGGRPPMLTNPV